MGFLDQASTIKEIPAVVLTAGFQAHCTLEVLGILQTFLNDEQKAVFALKDVTLYGLEAGNPARSMALGELYVRKDQCHVIAFEELFSHEDTGLMPRIEQLAVYTSHYAIQGGFHMGSDSLLGDFMASSKSQYVGVTNVQVFPLFQAQTAIIQQSPLAFVHRDAGQMHHHL